MRTLWLVIVAALLISCKPKEPQGIEVIDMDPHMLKDNYLSTVFEKDNIIELETTDSCLIRYLAQMVMTDEYIFISDNNQRVLQFDSEGHFIRQIGRNGRGPDEYIAVVRIEADPVNERIAVNDIRKIMFFGFDGQLQNSMSIKGSVMDYLTFIDGNLLTYNSYFGQEEPDGRFANVSKIFRYDDQFNITDSITIRKFIMSEFLGGSIWQWPYYVSDIESGIYVYYVTALPEPVLRDTLYKYEGSDLIPVVKADFSKVLSVDKSIDLVDLVKSGNYSAEEVNKIRNVRLNNMFRTERYVFVEYTYENLNNYGCFDLKEKKGIASHWGYADDLFGTDSLATFRPLDLRKNIFYFYKDGYEVEGIIDGITENSNPVLFMMKTKE